MSTRPPDWCAKYVGKPFGEKGRGPDAFDCWGLVLEVLQREFGVSDMPDYSGDYLSPFDPISVAEAVAGAKASGRFQPVHEAQPGTIIILRLQGRPWHCAVAADHRWMLHTVANANTVLELTGSWIWRNHIEGMYRYV